MKCELVENVFGINRKEKYHVDVQSIWQKYLANSYKIL
jgi:hypothetical protein